MLYRKKTGQLEFSVEAREMDKVGRDETTNNNETLCACSRLLCAWRSWSWQLPRTRRRTRSGSLRIRRHSRATRYRGCSGCWGSTGLMTRGVWRECIWATGWSLATTDRRLVSIYESLSPLNSGSYTWRVAGIATTTVAVGTGGCGCGTWWRQPNGLTHATVSPRSLIIRRAERKRFSARAWLDASKRRVVN